MAEVTQADLLRMPIEARANALADAGEGDPWELVGYFREKARQAEEQARAASAAAIKALRQRHEDPRPSLELCVQYSEDGKHIRKWSREPFEGGECLYAISPEAAARHREQAVKPLLDGTGFVFWNPDSGEEYSDQHPIKSGECPDAERVRKSTAQEDVLWAAFQEQFRRAEAVKPLVEALEKIRDLPPSPHSANQTALIAAQALGALVDEDWAGDWQNDTPSERARARAALRSVQS